MDSLFRWIVVGVFVCSSPFALVGAWEAYGVVGELQRGQQVVGVVVGNRQTVDRRDGVEERAFQPEVTFRSADGVERRFTDGVGSLPPDYAVGESVPVLYATTDPGHARVLSWKRLWLAPTIFVLAGLLPGFIAWVVVGRVSRRASVRG